MATPKVDIEATRSKVLKETDEVIKGLTLDDIRSQAMTIRIGGKLVKLEVVAEQVDDTSKIVEDLKAQFREKLKGIQTHINEKASEIENVISTYRNDFEAKERALEKRLSEANLMPDINREHGYKGLSVVKGGGRAYDGRPDIYSWIYRTVYKPTRLDGQPLDPTFAKKMITPVIIEVTTEKEKVIAVRTKKYVGDYDFPHYHKNCWGEWKYTTEKWKTADDILRICEKAIAILDNINSGSPADRNPAGLPRLETVRKHVITTNPGAGSIVSNDRGNERSGVNAVSPETVWST